MSLTEEESTRFHEMVDKTKTLIAQLKDIGIEITMSSSHLPYVFSESSLSHLSSLIKAVKPVMEQWNADFQQRYMTRAKEVSDETVTYMGHLVVDLSHKNDGV
jgi:hypothetical protein